MNNRLFRNSENFTKKERKALRTKYFILDAAKKLFSEKNFDLITMEEIAELAALSRATLYNYFNTKEEIYFNIGLSKIEHWIEQYDLLDSTKYSGKQLVLFLAENLVIDLLEFPFYSKVLRRFFNRSQELEIPVQEVFYNTIIKKKEFTNNSNLKPENKIFIDILHSYIDYRHLWQKSIEIGIKDGSITTLSNPNHLNFFLIMVIFGLLDQVDFRSSLMKMVNLSNDQITKFILRLTEKFLEGDI